MANNNYVSEYTMVFTANTSQAKNQLQELRNSLNNLSSLSAQVGKNPLGLTEELQKAVTVANQLKINLENATNVNTGQLDLGKFTQSMKKSGMSLKKYQAALRELGPEGDRAFSQLAQSISTAELPIKRSSKLLTEFATTLKNTTKWQISSSILHGFMGAIQSAYGYAQDLNESLNNIRIVTGKNTDQMAKFAKEANKAAKKLNTTTTSYTNASLIYYQQGLSNQEVKERTDVTIKMANVSRQSAETVSDQMTAIWNNFDNGSKSLEYYADVMTALGAATASSSDEIASGLEKFAAIADTVGLSYEYATSALATVTAETRQSAEVVGTAFKTMFARIQGLKLGETLEDGTTFNQYSEALMAVGINIKDANGELKNMDTILNEMGTKWQTLNRDEQVALAQKVAGVRQYSQLVALMDNWDKFQINLEIAEDSEGTLQKQADIYAESWEAASKKVKASLETVYQQILNDKSFIKILNVVAKIIDKISDLIDAFGGFGNVIMGIGAIILKVFQKDIATSLSNTYDRISSVSKKSQQEQMRQKEEANLLLMRQAADTGTASGAAKADAYSRQAQEQLAYIRNAERMTEEERTIYQIRMDQSKEINQQAIKAAEALEIEEQKLETLKLQSKVKVSPQTLNNVFKKDSATSYINKNIVQNINPGEMTQEQAKQAADQLKNLREGFSNLADPSFMDKNFSMSLDNLINSLENFTEKTKNELSEGLDSWKLYSEQVKSTANGVSDNLKKSGNKQDVENYKKDIDSFVKTSAKNSEINKKAEDYSKKLQGDMNGIPEKQAKISDGFVGMASSVMSFGFALQQLSSAWQTIRDPNASGWDKFLSIITTLGMTVPMVVTGFKSFKTAFSTLDVALTKNLNKKFLNKKATDELTKSTERSSQATDINEKKVNEESVAIDNNTKSKGKFSFFRRGKSKTKIKGASTKGGIAAGEGAVAEGGAAAEGEEAAAAGRSLLPILIGIAVVIGSITLAIKFFKKEATAAENAKKEAQQVSDSFDSAKEKYQELGQTISSYSDAVTEIKKMKEGTEEFKKAIFDANQQALELIKTYDNLKYTTDENGLINIDEESLKEVQEEQFRQVQDLQSAKMTADKIARDKQAKADEVALGRKLKTDQTKFQMDDGIATATGAAVGAAILGTLGSVVPVIGNTIGVVGGAAIGATIGVAGGAVAAKIKNDYEESEKEVFNQLVTLREERGDSIFATDDAFRNLLENELRIDDTKLVDSLVKQREEIQKNTEAVNKNTEQNKIENRTKIAERYGEEIKKENLNEKQQVFLTDTLSKTLEEKSSKNYDEKYTKGEYNNRFLGWGQDKDLQKLFMEKMGYSKVVGGVWDNTAEFYDSEGNSVGEYNEDTMRQILAEMDALDDLNSDNAIGKNAELVRQLSQRDKELTQIYGDNIENYDLYKNALIDYGDSLGFTKDEMMNYINNAGENTKAAAKVKISKNLYNQLPEEQQTGLTEDLINNFVNNLGDQLSDEQIELAIDASANSKSVDEFARKLENAINDASLQGIESSLETAQSILEDGELKTEELTTLKEDDKFKEFLESQSITLAEFTTSTYTEQYAIVSEYYSKLRQLQGSVIGKENDNYQKQIIDLQAIIDYKNAMANKDFETAEAIKEQFSDINFDAYKDTKITDLNSEIDELQSKMEELQDKEIEINLSWEGIDAIEGGYKKLGSMSKALQEDAKQVGDEYQLTAQSATEWMKVYPDLFKQAEVSEDGIVSLNKETVDQYIKGQEDQVDANADAKIQELQAEKEKLLAQKKIIQQDLELAKNKLVGEENLSKASTDYLMRLRAGLTDYYKKQGKTDVEADEMALKDMGINRAEYSKLVVDSCATNSLAQQDSSKEGSVESLKWYDRWAVDLETLFRTVKEAFKTLFTEGKLSFEWNKNKSEVLSEYQLDGETVSTTKINGEAYTSGLNTQNYDFKSGDSINNVDNSEAEAAADALSKVTSDLTDTYESQLEMIDGQVDTIDTQILALQALKNQDAKDYGETDVDKVTGKDKKKKEDKKKKLDEEIDRYHEINEELDDLNRNLDKISKATDKAFGKQKLALMDQEIAAVEDLADKTKEYVKEAEQNLNKDAARLNAFGAQYDSQGRISNYDEMYARETELYNKAVETGDEATIEAAEKRYEDFKQVISNYEDSLNTLEEKEDELQEYIDKAAEYELAKIEYQIELDVSLNQQDLDYIEYQLSMLGDDAFNEAQQLALLEQEASSYQAQGKAYATGVQTLLKNKGLSGADINKVMGGDLSVLQGKNFTAEDITLIQNSVKGMQDSNLALMKLNEKIKNTLPESFEAWNEKIDENLEKFDYYDSVGEHFKNIIDIVGTKPLGISPDFLKEMNLVQVANKKNEIEALTSNLEDLEAERAKAEEELSKAKSKESKEYWEDVLKKVQDREAEIQERIFTSTEEALQKIADIYTKEIQNSLDRFEKQVAGSFETLEKLQEAYDKRKTLNEQYIADYKKVYELNKLTRQLDKAIDDTDSIKNKKILQELQDEINQAQKKGNKLSEYDLQVLQKKYELKLAEAALDDAQNAKSQVRLVRNEEGDYNYIYTADESQVDNAIQNYEDKLYELQDLNEQYIEEMGAAFIQVQQEMVDALSKIQLQDFESYADYKKAVEETTAYYQERMNYYSSELQKGLDNNVSLYENEYQKCLEYNQLKQESYDTFTTTFKETTLGQIQQNYNSIAEYQADVNRAIYGDDPKNPGGLLGDLYSGYNEWKELTKTVLETAGADMSGFADGVSTDTGNAGGYVTGFAQTVATALIGKDGSSVAETLGLSADSFDALQKAVDGKVNGKDGLNSSVESFRYKVWGSVYDKNGIAQGSEDAKEDISNMSESAKDDFDTLADKVADWQTKWDTEIRSAIQANEDLMNSYNALIEALSQTYTDPNNVSTNTKRNITEEVHVVTYNGEQVSGSTTTTQEEEAYQTPPSSKKVKNEDATKAGGTTIQVILQDVADLGHEGIGLKYNNAWHFGGEKVFSSVSGAKTYIGSTINVPQNLEKLSHSDFMHYEDRLGRVHGGGGASFDTGGYTGSWGTSDGKIAMLHEKELVLNKDDTENMLKAVSILREISSILTLKAERSSIDQIVSSYFKSANSIQTNQNQTIEQNIQIQAEFPDATNQLEIEAAFNNLINSASQYVNRKDEIKTSNFVTAYALTPQK